MKNKCLGLNSILLILALIMTNTVSAQQVVKYDFENFPLGKLTDQREARKLLNSNSVKGVEEGRIQVKNSADHGKVLDVLYPKGVAVTNSSGMHAKSFFHDDDSGYEELYMSYWVYFPSDVDFKLGGKLPGLGCQKDGLNMSLRLMWRKEGLLEFYVHYNHDKKIKPYKASINWSRMDPYREPNGRPQPDQVTLNKGEWNHIEMYYKLNTPGEADGIMRGWLNGELAIDITDNDDFRMANEGGIDLNCMFISTFYGGSSDISWTPDKDEYALFDDFVVSKSRIGYPGGNSNTLPTVQVTSPEEGAEFEEDEAITINASASDSDGTISSVKFYAGTTLIDEDETSPYSAVWSGAAPGNYELKAIATDNDGGTTTSSTVNVTVKGDVALINVTGVSLNQTSIVLKPNQTFNLIETVEPANATDKSVVWGTEHEGIATISSTGMVQAISEGNTTITVKTNDGGFLATCQVNVEPAVIGECELGIPGAQAIETIKASWDKLFVLGSAPDLSSIKKLTINWNKENKGLYTFAVNTNGGKPAWYVKMKGNQSNTFASANPSITLTGTGIPAFEGEFNVNVKDGNFIMQKADGSYTMIFSTSSISPCEKAVQVKSGGLSSMHEVISEGLTVYPNPVANGAILNIERNSDSQALLFVYTMEGKKVFSQQIVEHREQLHLEDFQPGMYMLRVISNGKVENVNFLVD